MFHFPGCPPHELFIHSWVTGHYPSRVPPFGYPRIYAYLRLPWAFRSLSRPSSAISALASSLRSFSLDLPAGSRAPSALAASSLLPLRYVHLPKTIEKCSYLSSFGLRSALPTGFLPRFPSTSFGFFFPCAVFKVRLRLPPSLPVCLSLPLPFPLPAAFEVSLFSDPSKRYSEEFPSDASPLSLRWLYTGLTVFRLAVSRLVPQSWVPQSPAGLSGSPGSLPPSGFRLLASAPRFDLGCE